MLAFEQDGYAPIHNKRNFKCTQNDPLSYQGIRKSKFKSKSTKDNSVFIQAKYMIISTDDVLTGNLEEQLNLVTSIDNKDGSKIKVILGSSVACEGLDFKFVRSTHILEPWHNMNKLEQVIGRGIRHCSHKDLDEIDRNTTIYFHTSALEKLETIDVYLYRNCEKKAIDIGKIETLLKHNAIDKYLFQTENYIDASSVNNMKINPALRNGPGSEIFDYRPNDKKYTRVCSFQSSCNYMKNDPILDLDTLTIDTLNTDTFDIFYSQGLTNMYKKRIALQFKTILSFTFEELILALSEFIELYEEFVLHALFQMIHEKYIIHNHNYSGYIIYSGNVFLFQPHFNEDKLLPLYYRTQRGITQKKQLIIESSGGPASKLNMKPQSFTSDEILEIHSIISTRSFSPNEQQIISMLSLRDEYEYVKYAYIVDRLTFNNKKILLFSIMNYLHTQKLIGNQKLVDILILILQKQFIYYDKRTFQYHSEYKEEYKLWGFFIYHSINKAPVCYSYQKNKIQISEEIDNVAIHRVLLTLKRKKKWNTKNIHWGYTIYSERYKHTDNGIVLKIVKKNDPVKDRYIFPPGPGNVVMSQSIGAWLGDSTLNFIMSEIPEYQFFEKIDKKRLQKNYTKKEYVFFLEMYLRKVNQFFPRDLIWIKYLL